MWKQFLTTALFLGTSSVLLSSCGMMMGSMAGMMGNGDKWNAMLNMDEVMDEDGMSMDLIMQKRNEAETAAYARGHELFTETTGKANKSCNSCHSGGGASSQKAKVWDSGVSLTIATLKGAAARYPKYDRASDTVISLQMRNNNCRTMFMGAEALGLESWDSYALAHYVTGFSNGESVQTGSR